MLVQPVPRSHVYAASARVNLNVRMRYGLTMEVFIKYFMTNIY